MNYNRWIVHYQQERSRRPLLPMPPTSVPMPNPAWESNYNYTPYHQSLHQNTLRPGWSTMGPSAVPYHRSHPYGYANPHHKPTAMYPVVPAVPPGKVTVHPQGKRKYPSELDRPKATALNLRFDTSSEKAYLIWDIYPGRKDIYYRVGVLCTSSACNFESSGEGRRWSFEQSWTQTSKLLTTTPGNVYNITVEVRDLTTKKIIYQEEKEFKACMSVAEHEMLYQKAAKFATKKMHPFQYLYRCKPKIYWDYIHRQNYDLMEKYVKDNNGQPSNQINGNIHGLFFSARLQPDGTLPTSSPFGDVRMLIHGHVMLDPDKHNFYFADFYCNYLTHYVTIVVCVKGSETDDFCKERCFPIDIFDNPFIKIVRTWNNFEKCNQYAYFVCRDIWVEIYYTENVHLNWGRFSDIIATGAGTSKIGGLPNNKQCTVCNLYRALPSVKFEPDGPLDMTFLDDQLLQSSTFRKICEQDKRGLEEDWEDLVEVICSIVDGACELQIEEQSVKEKSSDPIVQGNREIAQMIKDTEIDLGSSVILKAIPKLSEAWLAVKKHTEDFKEKLAMLQTLCEEREKCTENDGTSGQDIIACDPEEGSRPVDTKSSTRLEESVTVKDPGFVLVLSGLIVSLSIIPIRHELGTMDAFLAWCREEGMLFDGIDVRSAGENAGYGVFATRNFRPEEKLIVIPDEFMLTGGKVADMEGYSDIADRADPPLTPFEMLTVFFAMENPDDSEWGPYLRILPVSFDTPSYLGIDFSPDDLPLSSREHWRKHQAELEQNLTKIEALLPQIPRQKLLWAWHVVYTRCVYNENRHHPKLDNSDDDTLIVAPLIDMLNHDNVSQCVFLTDKVKRNYLVKANRTVMEGDQALVTYGGHTNARLWFCYGFRLPENVNNKVEIPYYLLFELAVHIGLDIRTENENAIYEINFPSTIYASDESLSWQFLTNVKILLMSKDGAIQYRTHVLNNIDYDQEPELPLRIRVHETSIRLLEALIENMNVEKSNVNLYSFSNSYLFRAPHAVRWIWDEDIGLLVKTLAKTREELVELEAAQNETGAQDDDED